MVDTQDGLQHMASVLIPWSNTLISSLHIGSHPLQSTDRRGRPRGIGFAGRDRIRYETS